MLRNRYKRIENEMLVLSKYLGIKTDAPLVSTPWLRSLDQKERDTVIECKRKYPISSTAYDIVKQAMEANDHDTVSRMKELDPPISWDRIARFIKSTSMYELLGDRLHGTYMVPEDLVPVDDSFLAIVAAGRLDLLQDRVMEEDVSKYETPSISTILLMDFIPIGGLEWLISDEYWDGTPLARAVTMDRYEELADDPLDTDAVGVILHYDAYSVYTHYKVTVMKYPELIRVAKGRVREDMLKMYPIIIHAIDDPHLTVDDIDIMMKTAKGTNLQDDVWDKASTLNMVEILDKYHDMVNETVS